MSADQYTFRVRWSPQDESYVATIAEFPSLSWLAGSQTEALTGAVELVREVVADMEASGETPPTPLALRPYSGRFVVRVPASLHRALATEAAEQHISLNRLVTDRLGRA